MPVSAMFKGKRRYFHKARCSDEMGSARSPCK
jgi:hypothetical protein